MILYRDAGAPVQSPGHRSSSRAGYLLVSLSSDNAYVNKSGPQWSSRRMPRPGWLGALFLSYRGSALSWRNTCARLLVPKGELRDNGHRKGLGMEDVAMLIVRMVRAWSALVPG